MIGLRTAAQRTCIIIRFEIHVNILDMHLTYKDNNECCHLLNSNRIQTSQNLMANILNEKSVDKNFWGFSRIVDTKNQILDRTNSSLQRALQ